jgi:autotransporter passenger strand-loop-strand repeat protein
VASNVLVENGGVFSVLSGGTASGTTVGSGGAEVVSSGGVASGSLVSGGTQTISGGGLAVSATVSAGGVQQVASSASAQNTLVSAGGTQTVSGTASSTTLAGGSQDVMSGGVAQHTSVTAGGEQRVSSGGLAVSTTLAASGTQTLIDGGVASATTVGSGGTQNVLAGGTANGTTLNAGGLQYVDGVVEGYANNTVVNSGGVQQVAFGGTANSATVNSGGLQQVQSGGLADDTLLAGGTQQVSSGGAASRTTVDAGGVQQVLSGGLVTSTVVNSGGTLTGDGDVAGVTVTAGGLVQNLGSASQGIVDNGAVQVDTATAANVAVDSGGTLFGSGTLTGAANINAGGMLAATTPGSALHVNGSLAFNDGSTFVVSANATGQAGSVAVTGDVDIASTGANGGAKVAVDASPDAWKPNTKYTILSYTGTLTGAFAGVSTDYAYLSPTLSYASQEVDLTLNIASLFWQTGQFSGFGLVGQNQNQLQVASALNRIYAGGAGGNAITAALLLESTAGARAALTEMAGDEAANLMRVARQNTEALQNTVDGRLTAASIARPSNDLWAQVRYGQSHNSGDASVGSSALDVQTSSLTIGYDRQVLRDVRVGVAIDADYSNLGFNEPGASGQANGWQALVYGAWQPATQPFFARAMVGTGRWSNAVNRSVAFSDLSGTPQGSVRTESTTGYVEGGLNLHLRDDMTVQPYLGVRVGHYGQAGYGESGGNLFDLVYQGNGQAATTGVAGMRYLFTQKRSDGSTNTWEIDANVQQRFGSLAQTLDAAFASAPGAAYQVSGTPLARTVVDLATGGEWEIGRNASVFARVGVDVGKHEQDYSGEAGLNWKF